MLLNPPKPNADQAAQIDAMLERAAAHERAKAESFERCDTDGFVSQWASGINAQKERKQVEILQNGGHAQFLVLLDENGNVIADKIHEFKNQWSHGYDSKWRLGDDDAEKYGRRWIPVGSNSRVQAGFGMSEDMRWFPAKAAIIAHGSGLSGAASAYVAAVRI